MPGRDTYLHGLLLVLHDLYVLIYIFKMEESVDR